MHFFVHNSLEVDNPKKSDLLTRGDLHREGITQYMWQCLLVNYLGILNDFVQNLKIYFFVLHNISLKKVLESYASYDKNSINADGALVIRRSHVACFPARAFQQPRTHVSTEGKTSDWSIFAGKPPMINQ